MKFREAFFKQQIMSLKFCFMSCVQKQKYLQSRALVKSAMRAAENLDVVRVHTGTNPKDRGNAVAC